MAKNSTPSAPLPDDVAGLELSPEAAAAMAEVSAPALATRPSAAARAGLANPDDALRVGTAAVPGRIEYVYGDAKVMIKTN